MRINVFAINLLLLSFLGCFIWMSFDGWDTAYYGAHKRFTNVSEVTVNRSFEGIIRYSTWEHTECTPSEICEPDKYNVFIECHTVEPTCIYYIHVFVTTTDRNVVKQLEALDFDITRWGWWAVPCGNTAQDLDYTQKFSFMGIAGIKSIVGILASLLIICYLPIANERRNIK